MASSSSSSTTQRKPDVFLSFRGKDTRDGFLSHLYADLCRNKIDTFLDEELDGGEGISPALLKIIEESRISVVVFSKNYADSPWCLDELEKILECKEKFDQKVLPVFYQVDPTDIQELRGGFGDALDQHQRQFTSEKVERWRHALKEIANLSGWDSHNIKPESKLIQEIVNDILKKLYHMSSTNFDGLDNFDGLVGIESGIKEVELLLRIGSQGMCIVGIWGMGGIGKTTIAKTVFCRISTHFEGRCFLPNIREESEKHSLDYLQCEILSAVLEKENLSISMINSLFVKKMLQKKNVLIILDDVDCSQKLEKLVGDHDWYSSESRILVTSRDRQVLENKCDGIYEVKKLDYKEALKLFQLHAFKQNHFLEGYLELSERVVNYVDGIPLALKVLGCDLYKKGTKEWESKLAKLKDIPNTKVQKVLRISYDGLDRIEQRIFLDIACFFKGCFKDYVERILDECDFFATDGIRNLNDKSLITISNNKIGMHDLIQQMGQNIVREECTNEPGKWSRLWFHKDICHVLTKQTGTPILETISLDTSKIEEIHVCPTAFKEMCNLRLLKFSSGDWWHEAKVQLPKGLKYLSNELRLLQWDGYPLKSLPSNFYPKNLVELTITLSRIKQLWDGVQPELVNLKSLNLSYSVDLTGTPDFSKMPNLEDINLEHCRSLVKVHSSIGRCRKLTNLNLGECKNLCDLPSSIGHLSQLFTLNLADCKRLKSLPSSIDQLKCLSYLDMGRCLKIESLPSNIGQLKRLEFLNLTGCSKLASLPNSIGQLERLEYLYLSHCSKLSSLPDGIGQLERLEDLGLSGCSKLMSFPNSIGQLKCLQWLYLNECSKLSSLPDSFGQLEHLGYLDLSGSSKLVSLPNSIGQLKCLQWLFLNECPKLSSLPNNISQLEHLRYLGLSRCSKLVSLPNSIGQLKCLQWLYLNECSKLSSLPNSIGQLECLTGLDFKNCSNVNGLPDNFWNLQSLEFLRISNTTFMTKLPSSVNQLSKLRRLSLDNCGILEIPHNLGSLVLLTELYLNGNDFERIPADIKQLYNLRELDLSDCKRLQCLPELPSSLWKLNANNCTSLRSVPNLFAVKKKFGGFSFANSFNLDQSKIMADMRRKFRLGRMRMCVPGSEVPQWFRHKQTGSSLTMEPHHPRGWVICAVVAANGFATNEWSNIRCCCSYSPYFDSFNICGPMLWKSEHVWLWYEPNDRGSIQGEEVSFYTKATNYGVWYGPVIKCGVHPIFDQDDD